MPLTDKGKEIMASMREQYPSEEKAKEVFYASANKGTITGVHRAEGGLVKVGGTDKVTGGSPALPPDGPAAPAPKIKTRGTAATPSATSGPHQAKGQTVQRRNAGGLVKARTSGQSVSSYAHGGRMFKHRGRRNKGPLHEYYAA